MSQPRTGPHRRRRLTRDVIVRAALDLSEAEGLEKLSTHKVGAALGVTGMSLYNHVSDKSGLLDAMADAILAEVVLPDLAGESWEEQLRMLGRALRVAVSRYPQTAPLALTRRLNAPAVLPLVDATLEILREAGLERREAVHVLRVVIAFLVGSLTRELGLPSRTSELAAVDLTSFPHVASAGSELASIDHDLEFEYGMDLLLAGLRSRL